MRIVGEEDCKRSGGNGDPGFRCIAEESNVALVVERAGRLRAASERSPADLLAAFDRELDVDVAPVRFETRTGAPAPLCVIDRDVQAIAVECMTHAVALPRDGPRGKLGPVGVLQKLERSREFRVQRGITRRIAQRIEDHAVMVTRIAI